MYLTYLRIENMDLISTIFFATAILHTFLASQFQRVAASYPEGSWQENIFHLLGEVEVIFGFWAGLFVIFFGVREGFSSAVIFVESLNFTEPLFVFVIMAVSSTKPILYLAERLIFGFSRIIPLNRNLSALFSLLFLGPLLGSLVTEPAAMTITALLAKETFFSQPTSNRFKYGFIAVLFVNISIGGALTHFAAPPVVMVSQVWNWNTPYMFQNFGLGAILTVGLNTVGFILFLKKEILSLSNSQKVAFSFGPVPIWLVIIHLLTILAVVLTSHHPKFFIAILLFFLGVVTITKEYQTEVKLRESLLVAFFLGGLVTLGSLQSWWLKPLISSLNENSLLWGATALTAVTDNAALTFLGSQVEGLSESMKQALMAGALAGGGLTVIANAPNPIGYSLLAPYFGEKGLQPLKLLLAALAPTLCALLFL